jgi:ketosteroid isomerase-like protein
MASGKRLPGESFEEYRARLKREAEELELKLNGELVFVSSEVVKTGEDEKGRWEYGIAKRIYKKGETRLQGSRHAKNRYDKLLEKATRRGS